jgi:hypothetical protein
VEWALARRLVVELDSTIVPLATADVELIEALESASRSSAVGVSVP